MAAVAIASQRIPSGKAKHADGVMIIESARLGEVEFGMAWVRWASSMPCVGRALGLSEVARSQGVDYVSGEPSGFGTSGSQPRFK